MTSEQYVAIGSIRRKTSYVQVTECGLPKPFELTKTLRHSPFELCYHIQVSAARAMKETSNVMIVDTKTNAPDTRI